ncbi:flagellar assembly protein FliH [Shimia isoporae]|uniref:Flagellar assembly protein FliH n=1 Tax=Shimia isoporae TaxID=647720 RepID=A0A4R1NCP8_9RHOB|nr:ABC transporter ATP-binding protein [Shimia isoporae]TCL01433.1 flagellar assembly protein FliH [Shimia isoporae]
MTISHLLEDFGNSVEASSAAQTAEPVSEEALLDSYETGYKAGWDDATKAREDGQKAVSDSLAANLQDLSFTYHEAHEAVLGDIAPMVEKAIMTVLPEIARKSVGAVVVEELRRIIDTHGGTQVCLVTSQDDHDTVAAMIPEDLQFPVVLKSDPTLASGQAQFEFDSREREIDLSEVLGAVEQAFAAFTHETRKEAQNG